MGKTIQISEGVLQNLIDCLYDLLQETDIEPTQTKGLSGEI